MEAVNVLNLPPEWRKTIFAAYSVEKGANQIFSQYQGECFALVEAKPPNAEISAKLTADTAIWGYKVVRTRPFYWGDKRGLLRRIYRSTNIAVWQKQREPGFSEGLSASLAMVITGPLKFWWANVGDTGIFLWRNSKLKLLTKPDIERGKLIKAIGVERYGLVPQTKGENWYTGDTILLANNKLIEHITEDEISQVLATAGETTTQLEAAATKLVNLAQEHDKTGSFIAVLIKRVETDKVIIS